MVGYSMLIAAAAAFGMVQTGPTPMFHVKQST